MSKSGIQKQIETLRQLVAEGISELAIFDIAAAATGDLRVSFAEDGAYYFDFEVTIGSGLVVPMRNRLDNSSRGCGGIPPRTRGVDRTGQTSFEWGGSELDISGVKTMEGWKMRTEPVICPLLSGPKSLLFWVMKEFGNGQETQAGRDYRQVA